VSFDKIRATERFATSGKFERVSAGNVAAVSVFVITVFVTVTPVAWLLRAARQARRAPRISQSEGEFPQVVGKAVVPKTPRFGRTTVNPRGS
jgi:hypothetical protein